MGVATDDLDEREAYDGVDGEDAAVKMLIVIAVSLIAMRLSGSPAPSMTVRGFVVAEVGR